VHDHMIYLFENGEKVFIVLLSSIDQQFLHDFYLKLKSIVFF
jgi:hypothetical protein